MDKFEDMAIFVAVCEQRGFAAAARKLHMSPPGVTRAVAALEARIGTLLLTRNTRSVHMTQAGERYYHDCRRILSDVQDAADNAAGDEAPPRGVLTITAPVVFGERFVTPIILEFLQQFPQVTVRSLFVDRVVNLADEGVDVAVRIAPLPYMAVDPLVVGSVRRVVCAAPALLAREGEPQTPRELSRFRLIHAENVGDWKFKVEGEDFTLALQAPLTVNSNRAAVSAALRGYGVTRVMSYQVADDVAAGRLQLLLDAYAMPTIPVQLVCQDGRRLSRKAQSFVDFCAQRLRANPALN